MSYLLPSIGAQLLPPPSRIICSVLSAAQPGQDREPLGEASEPTLRAAAVEASSESA